MLNPHIKIKKKILIVEDDYDIATLLKSRLEKNNYTVINTASGYEGLYRYLREKPDLIILDIMLPGLDGYEVCREIRRTIRDVRTPILMLTAKTEDFDRIKGRVIDATQYMTKPVDGEKLLQTVRSLT